MTKDIDPYIKLLLEKWGRLPTTPNIDYPKTSPGFQEYQPRGFGDGLVLTDTTDVDVLADFIDNELGLNMTNALKAKFRKKLPKRKAAKYCRVSEKVYGELLRAAIGKIEYNLLEKAEEDLTQKVA